MAQIEETPLPGVGVRYAFATGADERLSVVHHHSGRVEVYLASPEHPDEATKLLDLDEDDSRVLAELLGASRVVREIDRLQQSVAGLSIEWLTVPEDSPAADRSIGDLEIRSVTGATVVATLRGGRTHSIPGPDFRLAAGDTLVVLGQRDDIRRIDQLLH